MVGDGMAQAHGNRFARHRKLTLCLLAVALSLAIAVLSERTLRSLLGDYSNYGTSRTILLREGRPNSSGMVTPYRWQIEASDTLPDKSFLLRHDENGFVMPSKVHDDPDQSIFFLGGSTTQCAYNEEEKRFPYLSGRLLEAATGKRTNSYNGGVSSNNSLHSIDVLYNKILPLNPEVVVLMQNVNDLHTLMTYDSYWASGNEFSPIVDQRSLAGASLSLVQRALPNLFALVRRATVNLLYSASGAQDEPADDRVPDIGSWTEQFRRNLRTFVAICRANAIQPALMTQPNRLTPDPDEAVQKYYDFLNTEYMHRVWVTYPQFQSFHEAFNEVIREVGRENDALVIDLDRAIPKGERYMYDPYHLTEAGSELVAEVISEQLRAYRER
jgi:hypothetical protein